MTEHSIVRAGQVYPVVVEPLRSGIAGLIDLAGDETACDPELLALGAPHLKWLLGDRPGLHDGRIVCWSHTGKDRIVASPGSYFDLLATCDAIRAEHQRGGDSAPLRDRAHASALRGRAGGRHRRVRAAHGPGGRRAAVRDGPPEPGARHRSRPVARRPSGMLERDPDGRHLETTVSRELAEELGVTIAPDEVARRGEVLGVIHDLLRLKPDVAVRLDLTAREALGLTAGDGEFVELGQFDITAQGFDDFWAARPPSTITAPAAGAVALLEQVAGLRRPAGG